MSIPRIPDQLHNKSLSNTILDLLESIALEETALSSLFNSEADKIQAFIGKNLDFPTKPTTNEILLFNETINKMLDSLLMTEWLLLRKMDSIIQIDISKMKEKKMNDDEDKESLWGDSSSTMNSVSFTEIDLFSNNNTHSVVDSKDSKAELDPETGDEDDFYW